MFGRRGNDGYSRRIVPGAPVTPGGPQAFAPPAPHQNGTAMPPVTSPNNFSRRIPPQPIPAAPAPAAHDIDALLKATESKLDKASEPVLRKTGGVQDALLAAKAKVQPALLERIDVGAASKLPRAELERQVADIAQEILTEEKLRLNMNEQKELVTMMLNDMLGYGPLEPLLADETVNDIMVNNANQVYVERRGKLEITDVKFRDDAHVLNVATRIVTRIGRRVDESSPMVDARLPDGSRVNIIIPPLAIDGPTISIRKFSKKKITLDVMMATKNLSQEMATVLKIASRCRL